MIPELHPVEVRVLGSLLEKEITTPEYYPLTLNALVNACNQKSNRDPAVSYDEDTVARALESLRAKGLAITTSGAGHRVAKHSHRISEALNLGRRELAVLCELMLRGAQTVGELRGRSERMHHFDETAEVESVLDRLIENGLAARLPRRSGEKEPRFVHLLSGAPEAAGPEPEPAGAAPPKRPAYDEDRVSALEQEVAQLKQELRDIKTQLGIA